MVAVESVAEFVASMPTSYREAFAHDEEAVEVHAGIASRREASATRVEIWKDLPERVVAICIVADDRPGLLSQISAALVACRNSRVTGFVGSLQMVALRPDGVTTRPMPSDPVKYAIPQ